MSFRGVIPILQTPFLDDERLDVESLERQVDFVWRAGADAACFPGFASEWWKLSDTEIDTAAQAIVRAAKGRVPVIFNVTAQSTHLAAAQARRFVELGADGLMCLPPFVVPRGADAVLAHLKAVLRSAPVPHILQYSASLTGLRLDIAQIRALRDEFPHFRSIKIDFIPPGPMITQLRDALGADEFTYLIGFAGLQLPDALARGAHGLMGGAGHAPEDVAVFRRLRAGQPGFNDLLPLLNLEMQTVDQSIATQKWLLKERGVFSTDRVRAPGPQLDGFQIAELRRYFTLAQEGTK